MMSVGLVGCSRVYPTKELFGSRLSLCPRYRRYGSCRKTSRLHQGALETCLLDIRLRLVRTPPSVERCVDESCLIYWGYPIGCVSRLCARDRSVSSGLSFVFTALSSSQGTLKVLWTSTPSSVAIRRSLHCGGAQTLAVWYPTINLWG